MPLQVAALKNRAETNTANTCVLIKNFSIEIVKLLLKYSLRSCDPTLISSHDAGSDDICDSLRVLCACQEHFNAVYLSLLLLERFELHNFTIKLDTYIL